MSTISITKVIEIKYEIIGIKDYVFCDDKKLYNTKTSNEIKQTINCRSKGYWIGRKFYSLNKLRPLLKKSENIQIPF